MTARAAVLGEAVPSAALEFAAGKGLNASGLRDLFGIDFGAEVGTARRIVDADPTLRTYPLLAADVSRLSGIRSDVDAGVGGFDSVNAFFSQLSADLDNTWLNQLAGLRRLADASPSLAGSFDRLLNAQDETFQAFTAGLHRVSFSQSLLGGQKSSADITGLIDANSRFAAASSRFGDLGPAAAAGWKSLQDDPATKRFESLIIQAAGVGLRGDPSPFATNFAAFGAAFKDSLRLVAHLTALVSAASTDLRTLAVAQQSAAARSFLAAVGGATLIALLSFAAALLLARSVAYPLRDLSSFAHKIGEGQFALPPLVLRGPKELAHTAESVNDMTATLAALERYAVTLAEDPNSASLTAPLPGRTGRALQRTLDQLRESIRAAEERRGQLEHLATHDGMSGLLNRSAAIEAIGRDLSRSQREGTTMIVMFIDVDGLKTINDTHGHNVGDDAIRFTADALRSTSRQSDLVARIGGDEFLVCGITNQDRAETEKLADRLCRAVADCAGRFGEAGIPLTCSIGIAVAAPGEETDAESLIENADSALYRSKQQGRNQVSWYDDIASPARTPGGSEVVGLAH